MRLFKRKDPVCGMKEEKGKGVEQNGKWLCSNRCAEEFETKNKESLNKKGSCCP